MSEEEIQAIDRRIISTSLLTEIFDKKIVKLKQSSAAVRKARQQQREKLLQEIRGLQTEVRELQKKNEQETNIMSEREQQICDIDNEIFLLRLNGDSVLTAATELQELFEKTKRETETLYREVEQLTKTTKKKK